MFRDYPGHPEEFRAVNRRSIRRRLRAELRDARVLLAESRTALLLFALIILGGSLVFHTFYRNPETGASISWGEALFATFTLVFLQPSLAFPTHGLLQILYFIIPIFGLVVVADGVIRFGVALTNKQERGQKWQVAMASTYSGHVIICGIGRVGYRVVLELLRYQRDVVVIESNSNCRFLEKIQALDIPVIIADARRQENLVKAGVYQADAVIPCTDDELANLDIALDARELNPDIKVVMRLFDPDLAQRIERGFGIHTAFSVSALAAPTIAAATMRVNVKSSFYAAGSLLHISEYPIEPGSPLVGWTIGRLENEYNLSVVGYLHGEETQLHPSEELALTSGSKLLILGALEDLNRLNKMKA